MNKIPLVIFAVIAVFLGALLLKGQDPSVVTSPLIGKPAPALPGLKKGQKALVNFFASWCVECALEQKTLMRIAQDGKITLIGVAYKDRPEKTKAWLKKFGNPYAKIVDDPDGRIALEWGVYGVPETFFVDDDGLVHEKHVGALLRENQVIKR